MGAYGFTYYISANSLEEATGELRELFENNRVSSYDLKGKETELPKSLMDEEIERYKSFLRGQIQTYKYLLEKTEKGGLLELEYSAILGTYKGVQNAFENIFTKELMPMSD